MFDAFGNPLPFGNGNGKMVFSTIVPTCFNTKPKKPRRFVNGKPVFDDGPVNEGGTRRSLKSAKQASAIRKMALARQRII